MAYEQKDNSGSLFKNDRKESDTHPDYKGSALLNGVEHWVDAWINEKRDGSGKYLAFKVKPKEQQAPQRGYSGSYNGNPQTNGSGSARQSSPPGFDDLSDEIPF